MERLPCTQGRVNRDAPADIVRDAVRVAARACARRCRCQPYPQADPAYRRSARALGVCVAACAMMHPVRRKRAPGTTIIASDPGATIATAVMSHREIRRRSGSGHGYLGTLEYPRQGG